MPRIDIHDIAKWRKVAHQSRYKVEVFAEYLNISSRQLRRYTQDLFACNPQCWLAEERMLGAVQMLKVERSVKVVVSELGYKQSSHFSSAFRRRYGLSPSEYIAKMDEMADLDNKNIVQVKLGIPKILPD